MVVPLIGTGLSHHQLSENWAPPHSSFFIQLSDHISELAIIYLKTRANRVVDSFLQIEWTFNKRGRNTIIFLFSFAMYSEPVA